MTAAEFAARRGVNRATLQHWKWVLGRDGHERPQTTALAKIVELRPAAQTADDDRFEVQVAGGRRVRVPGVLR